MTPAFAKATAGKQVMGVEIPASSQRKTRPENPAGLQSR